MQSNTKKSKQVNAYSYHIYNCIKVYICCHQKEQKSETDFADNGYPMAVFSDWHSVYFKALSQLRIALGKNRISNTNSVNAV
jgi:hypothetical protein